MNKKQYSILLSKVPVSALFILTQPIIPLVFFRARDRAEFANIDSVAKIKIAFILLAGLWLIIRSRNIGHQIRTILFSRPLIYLTCYLILAALSTLWSTHPKLTLYRCVESCIWLGLIIDAVLSAKNIKHALLIFAGYGTIVFMAIMITLIRTRVPEGANSIIEIMHENVPATIAALCMFLCITYYKQNRFRNLFWFFALAVVLITSVATYVAVLITALIAAFRFGSVRIKAVALIAVGLVLVMGLGFGTSSLVNVITIGRSSEGIRNLTGRVGMWESYMDDTISSNLFLGRGYVAGEHQERDRSYLASAHNVFIAAMVNLGIPGTILIFALALSMIYQSILIKGTLGMALCCASICLWINSMTIPCISGRVIASWVATAWICVLIAAVRNGWLVNSTK